MSKSIRIRTTPNGEDKFVKVNLEQDFDFVEILSLRLTQKELYTKFCADYGVIVGRITVNSGFGVLLNFGVIFIRKHCYGLYRIFYDK